MEAIASFPRDSTYATLTVQDFMCVFESAKYCKLGNIRGNIFANFGQQARIQKPAENICDILYAHLGHVGVVCWPCVLMQMGNILENVWGLLCPFYAAQLLVNVSWYDVNFVQYKNDKWASAKREFNNPAEYVFVPPNAKN